MAAADHERLTWLAELDLLRDDVARWAERAGAWRPARECQALVRRLQQRNESVRVRLEAPLVVALLGGTGAGKSTLVNALAGAEVTTAGRQRPTTMEPVVVAPREVPPEAVGLPREGVRWVVTDEPGLRNLVLVDCPDPDTTEDLEAAETNLSRLRLLLPCCDVILVVSTQQKYRSRRVAEELATAAPGARLVFVQTHADTDGDIRPDWRRVLGAEYDPGDLFLVDGRAALAEALAGREPRGEFARLKRLLAEELAGNARLRVRRANVLDLTEHVLDGCEQRLVRYEPAVAALTERLTAARRTVLGRIMAELHAELRSNHRDWDARILAAVLDRWGASPFAWLLRLWQGIGGVASAWALGRVRSPTQLALWGAFEVGRRIRERQGRLRAEQALARPEASRAARNDLREAETRLQGYLRDAGFDLSGNEVESHDAPAALEAATRAVASDVHEVVGRLAARHSAWFVRIRYELLLGIPAAALAYRFGRNFLWDSWLAVEFGFRAVPVPMLGTDFLIAAGCLLALWGAGLVWAYSARLRRGLVQELARLSALEPEAVGGEALFPAVGRAVGEAESFRRELAQLRRRVAELLAGLGEGGGAVGGRRRDPRSVPAPVAEAVVP